MFNVVFSFSAIQTFLQSNVGSSPTLEISFILCLQEIIGNKPKGYFLFFFAFCFLYFKFKLHPIQILREDKTFLGTKKGSICWSTKFAIQFDKTASGKIS
jgi:hypothetical protein